jgi:N-acetylglucosamine-6-sulfatase
MPGRARRAHPPFRQALLGASISVLLVGAAALPAAAAGTISGFSPTHGPIGTTVVVSGSGFTGSTDVRFNGTSAAYSIDDDGQITATVPAGATSGPIEVDTPDGRATSADDFTVDPPAGPTIATVAPDRGPERAPVVVQGSGLLTTTHVRFGDAEAGFTVNADDRLTAFVPSGANTGRITVVTPFGSATSDGSFIVEPNVVIILSDDQRYDEMAHMPNVESDLIDEGVSFSNALVGNPLCCPSRTSILTGQTSGHDGVWSNDGAFGGFPSFHGDGSTIATWLSAAGYDTGLVGKYLNGYGPGASYIPPGWNRWVAFDGANGAYYGYDLEVDDSTIHFGTASGDYSTDVLARYADAFVRDAPDDQPLFLYFAPYGPHSPSTPPPRYAGTFSSEPGRRPPSFNEANVSDKPAYIRSHSLMGSKAVAKMDAHYRNVLESLRGVDDAVGTIVDALRDTGRLSNTLIFYLSDNGVLDGEHRWGSKVVPYEESIRVPLVVRWDRLAGTPRADSNLALNLDLAPTIAGAASVPAPGVDGVSLLPLLTGATTAGRSEFLIESLQSPKLKGQGIVPSYCGVRARSKVFVHYATGEEEYYTLGTDPYELTNKVNLRAAASTVAQLRDDARTLCNPLPPGMPAF